MEQSLINAVPNQSTDAGRWSHYRFQIFVAAWILYSTYYFCRKNLSVVMPMMACTETYQTFDLANLVFVFSLAYSAGQFLAGLAADRFGARVIGTAGGLISAGCTAAMAVPGPHWTLLMLQVGNGIGTRLRMVFVSEDFGTHGSQARERGTVHRVVGRRVTSSADFLATVFATWSATTSLIGSGLGWHRGFLFPAMVLAAGGSLFAWKFPKPAGRGLAAAGGIARAGRPRLARRGGSWRATRRS